MLLKTIKIKPQVAELYKLILTEHFKNGSKSQLKEMKIIDDEILRKQNQATQRATADA